MYMSVPQAGRLNLIIMPDGKSRPWCCLREVLMVYEGGRGGGGVCVMGEKNYARLRFGGYQIR
jgi:hypothetical protein